MGSEGPRARLAWSRMAWGACTSQNREAQRPADVGEGGLPCCAFPADVQSAGGGKRTGGSRNLLSLIGGFKTLTLDCFDWARLKAGEGKKSHLPSISLAAVPVLTLPVLCRSKDSI